MLLGLISFILGIAGLVGALFGFPVLIIIGAVVDLAENIVGITVGGQNNVATPILFGVVGAVVALFMSAPFYMGIMVGLCCESVVMGVLSLPQYIAFFKRQ